MKVDKETWKQKMGNLFSRRAKGDFSGPKSYNPVGDYGRHLSRVKVGYKILDVGCGSQHLRVHLPNSLYNGLDAFPVVQGTVQGEIETIGFKDGEFDTVFAFAVLDGCHDLKAALENMKRITNGNIVILTGVDIPPDACHTVEVRESDIDSILSGMKKTYREVLAPKVLLLEYTK
jgi:ubiquinone/menaquinone biosynthesis C-methylase UbiE